MASAVIGALRVNLAIDSAQFRDGLNDARKSLGKVGKSMQTVGRNMSLAVSAPLAGLGVAILKTAGDFEASMSRLRAATGATGEQFSAMEKLARDLGKSTIFSALEASDAMETLAKNGLSVEQILGGAAQASLNLAAATGGDMSSAADLATDVMLSFGKEAKDLGEVVDGITGALLESKFGFDDYRMAVGQAGGVAGGLGVSFEDMNAALVATSNLFASGSDAGTSFKTFLTRLTPASDAAAAAMEQLGLEFFDAQGNMKDMDAIAEELRTGLAGLSEEAKTAALTDIFGRDAMRTAIGLAGTTAERFREIQTILADASAAEQAAARLGPFANAMEQLSGAFDELKISIAQSGLLEFITQAVTKLTEFVDVISETNPAFLKWGTVIAGVGIAIGPVVLGLGLLVTGVLAVSAPVLAAVAAIAALTAGVVAFWPQIDAAGQAVNRFLFSIGDSLHAAIDGAKQKFTELGAYLETLSAQLVEIFKAIPGQMAQIGKDIIAGLWNGIKGQWAIFKADVTSLGSSIAGFFRDPLKTHSPSKVMHEVGVDVMRGLGDGMNSMAGGIESIAQSIGSTISSAFQGVIDGSKSVKEAISEVLKSLASMLMNSAFQSLFAGIGGGGGGLGGLFSNLFGGLFGFANGGSFKVGGAGGIDSQVVAFRASPNEHVSVTKPGQERHGTQVSIVSRFDANGNFESVVEGISERTAAPMVRAGMQHANQAVVPTVSRYQNDRAGSDYRVA